MDNKLSELSKPVAWVTMQREFCDDERSVITNEVEAEKYSLDCYDLTPLYSQEYVSALQHESAVNWEAAASLNVENQELKKRIAELESDLGLKHVRAVEEALIFATDRNSELEAKLATPVRLPDPSQDKWLQWSGDYNFRSVAYFSAVKKAVRAAGFTFTVEGDEQ